VAGFQFGALSRTDADWPPFPTSLRIRASSHHSVLRIPEVKTIPPLSPAASKRSLRARTRFGRADLSPALLFRLSSPPPLQRAMGLSARMRTFTGPGFRRRLALHTEIFFLHRLPSSICPCCPFLLPRFIRQGPTFSQSPLKLSGDELWPVSSHSSLELFLFRDSRIQSDPFSTTTGTTPFPMVLLIKRSPA